MNNVELDSLAVSANTHHANVRAGRRGMLLSAKAAGTDLLRAKAIVGHGQFQAWREKRCPGLGMTTATNYTRIAKYWLDVQKATSIDGAIAIIRKKYGKSANPAEFELTAETFVEPEPVEALFRPYLISVFDDWASLLKCMPPAHATAARESLVRVRDEIDRVLAGS